jgi:uncharacterized protein involved in exopolysaccharide biosynthesis
VSDTTNTTNTMLAEIARITARHEQLRASLRHLAELTIERDFLLNQSRQAAYHRTTNDARRAYAELRTLIDTYHMQHGPLPPSLEEIAAELDQLPHLAPVGEVSRDAA